MVALAAKHCFAVYPGHNLAMHQDRHLHPSTLTQRLHQLWAALPSTLNIHWLSEDLFLSKHVRRSLLGVRHGRQAWIYTSSLTSGVLKKPSSRSLSSEKKAMPAQHSFSNSTASYS